MFGAREEKELRVKPGFKDLIREGGLQPSLSEEINWSGQGQHVQFGVAQNIPLKELNAIGHGGSALVDSVLCRRVKLARKTMMCTRRQKLETMINEVEHLQSLRHPHIVQLVGSYLQGKRFAILLYPVAEWNLSRFLELCQEIEYESEGSRPQITCPSGIFAMHSACHGLCPREYHQAHGYEATEYSCTSETEWNGSICRISVSFVAVG